MKPSSLFKYMLLPLLSGWSLTSCSWIMRPPENADEQKPDGFLKQLQAGGNASSQVQRSAMPAPPAGAQGVDVDTLEAMEKADRAAGVTFTDPDNPDKPISALDEAFQNTQKTDWYVSYIKAREQAMREHKPLLMWFTDSQNSPTSTALSNELLSKPKFSEWCDQNLIRLRIDANVKDPDRSTEIAKENFVKDLCKKYNVMGYPKLFMLTPDGQEVDNLAGYVPGSHEFVKRRIVNSARLAAKRYQTTKQRLESQGFRNWMGNNGSKIFAKLIRFSDEKGGTLVLQEANGNTVQTQITSLSVADANWVKAEKAKRQPAPRQ